MMPVRKICFVIALTLMALGAKAQTDAASVQALRTARAAYEQGRLQEIEAYLEEPLKRNRFSKSERIEAYRLLVLTYIYLEEPDKADDAMLKLLKTDHFFTPRNETDPAEFINLYKKFRTNPLFSIGLRASFLTTNVNVIEYHYLVGKRNGTFKSNQKISGGVTFEKDLLTFSRPKLKGVLVAAPEFFFTTREFTYTKPDVFEVDNIAEEIPTGLEATISQRLYQLNLIANYRFNKTFYTGKVVPYVGFGLSTSYLAAGRSSFLGELTVEQNGNNITGAQLDNTSNYKKLNFSLAMVGGLRWQVSDLYVTLDIRYFKGLHNVVDKANRYSLEGDLAEIQTRYLYVNSDLSINQLGASLGLVYPIFRPQKLTDKK
jgi:hypothetical protein